MSWRVILFVLVVLIYFTPSRNLSANYTTKLEQPINLIDQEYQTTSTTAGPTDNRLGLILWDGTKYSDESVYFEAILACVSCSGGNAQAKAELFTDSGSSVTGSSVTSLSTSYELVRTSPAITANLTNDEEYTVRLSLDADSGTACLKAARLIVLQSGTNLTDTQTQVELGNSDTSTNTSYELLTGPKIYYYDSDVYSGLTSALFEASLKSDNAVGTAYAALSTSATCASTLSGSEATASGTTWDRYRTGNLLTSLSDNTAYWVCVKSSPGHTASIANAKLIINQTESNGLSKIQIPYLLINTQITDGDNSYSNSLFPIKLNPGNYEADVKEFFFETILSASAGDAYARLFNTSDSTSISGSELTTNETAYARLRSADLYASLPTSTKNVDTQLRNSATNTTYSSSSTLIIQLTRILDPSLTFSVAGVGANTVNNGITTSIATEYNTVDFGHLTPQTPKYAAHALYAASNAPSGYTVTVKLLSYLQGLYPANNIDPFTSAWNTPTTWSEPDGSTPNDNTGWFGANTSDSRVSGWSDGANKFGAITNALQTIMQSSGSDSGTTAYVTYALEVNLLQPADQYSGSLIYNIVPTY